MRHRVLRCGRKLPKSAGHRRRFAKGAGFMRIIAAPVMQVLRLARPNRSVDGTSRPKSEPSEAPRQLAGVTMPEPGVSRLVSDDIDEASPMAGSA